MSSGASTRRRSPWPWLLALALFATPALAQTAPKSQAGPRSKTRARADRTPKAAEPADAAKSAAPASDAKAPEAKADDPAAEKPSGLFGDPKRFNRYSGWGSMGGTIGQFGLARSALISMPPVQEELKLSASQKDDVRKWLDQQRQRGETMARGLRPPQGSDPQPQGGVAVAARIMQFTAFLNQVGEMLRESEDGLARILKPTQRKRLDQIALQMEGIAAVARPDMAERLNLGPDQEEMIQQVLAQGRSMQMTTWIEQGRAMARLGRNRGEGGGGDGGNPNGPVASEPPAREPNPARASRPAQGQETKPSPEQGRAPAAGAGAGAGRNTSPPVDPKVRAEQQKAFRKQFETMRDQTDRIQDETTRAILKILTRKQRANFEKMLGEPFDPAKVNSLGRPPGAGGAGGSASPARAAVPENP